ncbi:MAG: glucose-1-phosphate cytidylyltransferase [Bacillota bacterium]|nr:glucose-1-phosphate cytidylyltransferase [Bacillota bacterium]MDW7684825.1 glucose-1-phosphate cytidylyltransferase [Bacillota bacterium]
MKTIILCGGLGTRLREETDFRPKAMVDIGERPILWHIMKIFAHYAYTDFILCLGYKGGVIKDYFCRYEMINSDITIRLGNPTDICFHQEHEENDWQVTLVDTGKDALKGARLKKIERYVDSFPCIVTYGDGLADIDIPSLLDFHRSHGRLATVTGVSSASRFGELKITGNQVSRFSEKPLNRNKYINGGFFVFEREIFDYLTTEDDCDLEFGALEKIAAEGQLMVYKHPGSWACMDTLRDMEHLNTLWMGNKAFWKIWP